ncbi:PIN domain-containing protein [Methyloprofundus sp.]|uniref:PIN domain-containing protein n=1 Tax=Methyloprofundus sp. TaxID=2020875 RepID=UPI003D0DEC6F
MGTPPYTATSGGRVMHYMNAKIFIDTNILVCAFDSNEKDKQEIAQNLLADEGFTGEIVLSTLVLQEFFVTVTSKLKEPLSIDDASKTIQLFNVYPIIQFTPRLILKAIERHQYESFSFWDALYYQVLRYCLVRICKMDGKWVSLRFQTRLANSIKVITPVNVSINKKSSWLPIDLDLTFTQKIFSLLAILQRQ